MNAKVNPRNNPRIITGATRSPLILAALSRGVNVAIRNTPTGWELHADALIQALADSGQRFTVDHVKANGLGEPDTPQHWGALFARHKVMGLIVDTGETVIHRTRGGATRRVKVWQGQPTTDSAADALEAAA